MTSLSPQQLRKLDALVAERVMGEVVRNVDENPRVFDGSLPRYSSDIAAAWKVVEKLCPTANKAEPWIQMHTSSGKWVVNFHRGALDTFADTAPLAICLAVLAVVGVDPAEWRGA